MLNAKELLKYTKSLSVLFIDDNKDLRENIFEILSNFFYKINNAIDGEDGLKKYKEYYNSENTYYDIVISDIQMPRVNGIDLIESIYSLNSDQAIIVMSAHDNPKYLLPLVNFGIAHFIKKPIDYQELLQVLLNTSKKIAHSKGEHTIQKDSQLINLNNFVTFSKENSILNDNNKVVTLTKYEILFLQLLTDNIGKIFSNEDIVSYYKSYNEVLDTVNIRKLVSKLRKKLPKDSIESVYGIGYRILPCLSN
jgi:DNA-binding response OmpR family regulator